MIHVPSASLSFVIPITAAFAMTACGGENTTPAKDPTAASATTTPTSAVLTINKSPDSGQVDKVGPGDGALSADGQKDLAFLVEVDGSIASVFLVAVDDKGTSNGQFQADTLVGEAEVPQEVAIKWGGGTAGLGVAEGDKLLNRPDGSIPALAEGHHRLVLYTSMAPTLTSGTRLRVFAQRPDKTVVIGGTITLN